MRTAQHREESTDVQGKVETRRMTARTLTFLGARGSMPVSGSPTNRYGGHTICIGIEAGAASMVLVDGGTGIIRLNRDEASEHVSDYHVFLTHYHWDHIQGLPFFRPLYEASNTFTFYGHRWNGLSSREALEGAVRPPWFPVSMEEAASRKHYVTIDRGVFEVGDLTITAAPLRHPQGVIAYRVDGPNRSIVIATDCERGDAPSDAVLRDLATGADILVHDAQYTPEEYEDRYVGWGHSTWAHAAQAAEEAGVGGLILVSHDPTRTDDEIDGIVAKARHAFGNTRAASEGMQIEL